MARIINNVVSWSETRLALMLVVILAGLSSAIHADQTPGPYALIREIEIRDEVDGELKVTSHGITVEWTIGAITIPVYCKGLVGETLEWRAPNNWSDLIVYYVGTKEVWDLTENHEIPIFTYEIGEELEIPLSTFGDWGPDERSITFPIFRGLLSFDFGTKIKYDVLIDGGRSVFLDQDSTH